MVPPLPGAFVDLLFELTDAGFAHDLKVSPERRGWGGGQATDGVTLASAGFPSCHAR